MHSGAFVEDEVAALLSHRTQTMEYFAAITESSLVNKNAIEYM